jgi:hypothetical protein
MKVTLTEQEQAEMRGLLPFNSEAFDFIPDVFKIKEDGKFLIREKLWPTFKLRPFTKPERDQVRRVLIDLKADAKKVEHGTVTEWARKITLGWKNLINMATGEEIPYKADPAGGADVAAFDALPENLIAAILYRGITTSGLVNSERLGLGY